MNMEAMPPAGEQSPEKEPAIRSGEELEKIREVLRLFEENRARRGGAPLDDEKVIAAAVEARRAAEREVSALRPSDEADGYSRQAA